jgi:hypothetical protein
VPIGFDVVAGVGFAVAGARRLHLCRARRAEGNGAGRGAAPGRRPSFAAGELDARAAPMVPRPQGPALFWQGRGPRCAAAQAHPLAVRCNDTSPMTLGTGAGRGFSAPVLIVAFSARAGAPSAGGEVADVLAVHAAQQPVVRAQGRLGLLPDVWGFKARRVCVQPRGPWCRVWGMCAAKGPWAPGAGGSSTARARVQGLMMGPRVATMRRRPSRPTTKASRRAPSHPTGRKTTSSPAK